MAANQLPKLHTLRPLEYLHPLESTARRSDILVSDGTKRELEEMRRTVQNEVDRLDQEITQYEVIIQRLHEQRTACTSRIAEITCAIAPHKYLPPEILSRIFYLCEDGSSVIVPPGAKGIGRCCWVIGRVCARWRQIALSTRELWESITIGAFPYDESSPYMDERNRLIAIYAESFFHRGVRKLTIDLRPASLWKRRKLPQKPLLRMLYQYASQLKELSFSCFLPFMESMLGLPPPSFDILTCVTIIIRSRRGGAVAPNRTPILPAEPALFRNSPCLTSLHIKTLGKDSHDLRLPNSGNAWSHLTTISFGNRIFISRAEIHSFLAQCPTLTKCTLKLCRAEDNPHDADAISQHRNNIVLSNLQVLEITTAVQPSSFLQPLVLPSLRSFDMYCHSPVECGRDKGLIPFLSRFGGILECLTLNSRIQPQQLELLLTSLSPSLRELDISLSAIDAVMLGGIANGSLLPKLHSITCLINTLELLDAFVNIVDTRWGVEDSSTANIRTAIANADITYGSDLWVEMEQRINDLNTKYRDHGRCIEIIMDDDES